MKNQDIDFDDFINEFYSNMDKKKMVLHVDIKNNTDTSNYDIHCMLLDLFFNSL